MIIASAAVVIGLFFFLVEPAIKERNAFKIDLAHYNTLKEIPTYLLDDTIARIDISPDSVRCTKDNLCKADSIKKNYQNTRFIEKFDDIVEGNLIKIDSVALSLRDYWNDLALANEKNKAEYEEYYNYYATPVI